MQINGTADSSDLVQGHWSVWSFDLQLEDNVQDDSDMFISSPGFNFTWCGNLTSDLVKGCEVYDHIGKARVRTGAMLVGSAKFNVLVRNPTTPSDTNNTFTISIEKDKIRKQEGIISGRVITDLGVLAYHG
eukprot:Platyproteum_vivax@DN14940_c0_g1_i1.p1